MKIPLLMFLAVIFTGAVAAAEDLADATWLDDAEAIEVEPESSPVFITYSSIMYGPSISQPTGFQPTASGKRDPERPVFIKNFLGVGYNISDALFVNATAFWNWYPVGGQELQIRDPFLRLAHRRLISGDGFNLYADLRFHFPVTSVSRENDLLAGVQSFQSFTYDVPATDLTLGVYNSVRGNLFGKQGYGSDLDLYFAPNLNYQISPTVAFTLLYEVQGSHDFGDRPFLFYNDGTDIEPGISWDITPNINVNPYLHILPARPTLAATSFGVMFYWQMF